MGVHDAALGFVYSSLVISIDIGICSIFFGIHVLHYDTCHHVRIRDSALSHDRDAMSSHMPRGPIRFILHAHLDVISTLVNYYLSSNNTWEILMQWS
jgi:hypothetical protein